MAGKAKYLFIASMDVDADKEALFNEVCLLYTSPSPRD